MIGLLKKDLFVADKSGRLLVVLAIVFSVIPKMGNFGSTYAMMLGMMMPLTSIAYDEKSKWDKYAAMLPYRTSHLVLSKYLLAYIYILLGGSIVVLGSLLRGSITGAMDWVETMEMTAALGIIVPFVTALDLPLVYRFGSERGRLVMLLIIGSGMGAVFGILSVKDQLPEPPSLPLPALAAAIAILAVAANVVSIRLSVHFYRKRQNGRYN